jgi:two-component system sensor histidine kinase KdpD
VVGWLVVEVGDGGPGLPADERERVFDKFYRGRSAGSAPGAGLGLTICRGIVVAHGGTISADSRPGGGLAVRIRLPAVPVVPAPPTPEKEP